MGSATALQKFFASFFQKRSAFFFSALALAACSSPEPTLYTLAPVSGAALPAAGAIEVRRPGLAGYLDRSSILQSTTGFKLDVGTQQRWAEPFGDMLGRVLAADLSQRLPGGTVFAEGGSISADPAFRVEVDIARFDPQDGQVTLTAQWAVERGRGHEPVASHTYTASAPAGADAEAMAAAMSGLLGGLSDAIAPVLAGGGR